MPPPKSKGAGKAKPEEQRDEPLQAVVLADSFTTAFPPLTSSKPRCLLPLANTPLIEYTLDFLARNGVQQVFIYAASHADQVEAYFQAPTSPYTHPYPVSPFQSLTVLKLPTATSVGDCMRDLDNRDLVAGDFLVVSGDVVSNLNLGAALHQHRARRTQDKNAIMTVVLKEDPHFYSRDAQAARQQSTSKSPVYVIDPQQARCLHYEEIRTAVGPADMSREIKSQKSKQKRKHDTRMLLDPEILTTHAAIDIRADLIDPYIDICTIDVLAQWSENFDYTSLRASFLFGVLKDYELNGKTIHTHIVTDASYAARVSGFRAYDDISQDLLARWAYPLAVDSNLLPGQIFETKRGGKVYQEVEGVEIARGVELKGRCVIGGKGTSIQSGSLVESSVLGRGCKIGRNVRIQHAYVWENVDIGDNVAISGPVVIGDGARISANATILPGSVINRNAVVAEGAKVDPSSNGAAQDSEDAVDVSDDDQPIQLLLPPSIYKTNLPASLSQLSMSTFASASDVDDDAAGDEDDTAALSHRRSSSIRSDTFSMSSGTYDEDAIIKNRSFQIEATANVLDGLVKHDAAETIFLELNSFRLSVDASQHSVRRSVATAFTRRIYELVSAEPPTTPRQAVHELFSSYKVLLDRIILDRDNVGTARPDQTDLLLLIQQECFRLTSPNRSHVNQQRRRSSEGGGGGGGDNAATEPRPAGPLSMASAQQVLLFMAKELYDLEIVEEDGILQWWDDGRSSEREGMAEVKSLAEQFVRFLKEAEEEEDDEDDDGDDDSEEE